MKRYDLELAATGPVMEEHEQGAFVPFSEVDQLNQRINQLLEERNSTGIAISNAILSGVVPDKHPLRSRLELLANHHKRERELESLLREVTKVIPAIGVAIDDLPVVDAFLERIETALDGQMPHHPERPLDMVSLSDIHSIQRYTLGGHCDSFCQDCGAEVEQDDDGEYILLAEVLKLAGRKPQGGEPCALEPRSSSQD